MITKTKLEIYKSFDGDIDGWARIGNKKQKENIDDKDWFIVDELIQSINQINKSTASESFKSDLKTKLKKYCADEETIIEIKKLAGDYPI